MEQWWKDIDRRKLKNPEKNLSHCHFVHRKSHMGVNPDLRSEKLATNCLSYVTALIGHLLHSISQR
jgi:hypothetical protein